MERRWRYFLLLLWFSYLFISSVLLFTRGFLLKRDVLPNIARCKTNEACSSSKNYYLNNSSRGEVSGNISEENGHCSDDYWTENKAVEDQLTCQASRAKVVLIVIDALKYDFVYYNSNVQESEILPYQNRLSIINDLLQKESNHARLFKFIADPPTTTMQRLKGLTTGSLPTFIDVGSNFATAEINEDNLIDQLKAQNKNIVFMGDDTWSGLYPKRFIREYSFPSFNVWDLDTVDDGIMNHLLPEIVKKDWNLLIAHFLGVDHCGHRYGPHHPEMSRKLDEMNEMIRSVVDTIDDSTMLFVIGDHGMTNTGDHGGDSEDEVTAGMFVYSSKPFLLEGTVPHSDIVNQVDLVPTLSAILGLPIPFSNLGAVILDILPSGNNPENLVSGWNFAMKSLWQNIQQIMDYLKLYSSTSKQLSQDKLSILIKNFSTLKEMVKSVSSVDDFIDFSSYARGFLTLAREMCEDVWVQFDSVLMFHGLTLTFISGCFIFLIVDGIPSSELKEIVTGSFLGVVFGCIILTAVGVLTCGYLEFIDDVEVSIYFSTGLISVLIMFIVICNNWFTILTHCHNQMKNIDWPTMVSRVMVFLSLCGMFSNSYVVEEARVLSYLFLTMAWLLVYCLTPVRTEPVGRGKSVEKQAWFSKTSLSSFQSKLIMCVVLLSVVVRLSQYYWLCREEQIGCESSMPQKAYLVESLINLRYCNSQCLFTLICLAFFVTIVRIWLRSCGNLVGFSPTVMFSRYGPTLLVICMGGNWVLQSLPRDSRSKLLLPWQVHILPYIIFGLLGVALLIMFVKPLSVFMVPKKKETMTFPIYGNTNIIPHIFNQMKEIIQESSKETGDKNDFPIVYGLATVYSAAFVNVGVFVSLLVALVMGISLAPSVVLMSAAGVLLITLLSVLHYERVLNTGQLFDVPWSAVLCWGFFTLYYFYGTGHNATFPGIQWEAAFVSTGGQFSSNHIAQAFLIIVNTFAAQIVMSIMLPLLLIVPFTLHIMFPNIMPSASKDAVRCKDLKRGELTIYEHDELLYQGTFILSTKYFLFFGVRIFASMLAATVHSRHLMVWKIFAPKFIFEGLGVFVTLPCILLSYLLVVRITVQIEELLQHLDKGNR